jgi:UTP--glucose-1-phosphate uridylyltransferase
LEEIRKITQMANFVYVRQKKHLPYGNATPLLTVESLIDDDEAFVYMFGDDMTISDVPVTKQVIDLFEKEHPSAVLAVQEVSPEEIERYASIKYKENGGHKYEMEEGLEKVSRDKAPSNMAQFGRFVFSYDVIEQAKNTSRGKDNELWVIDVLNGLAKEGKLVLAQPIEGEWLTTGDPLRYLKTTLKFAMLREDISKDLREFIQKEL